LEESKHTQLSRCLTTTDLIALGVGSTLGAGVYVLTGSVARDKAGPSIVLSFLIAAVASVMAGLCYAEFGSRVPKAGSAYVYSYITLGELWAFVIGWNLILEYVIGKYLYLGTSSVARAWSENVDALIGGKFRDFSLTYLKMETPGFAEYPDFFAFAIILVLTGVLCFGVKESAMFSKIFTGVNILIILFVIVAGSLTADINNWYITAQDIQNHNKVCESSKNLGTGGFFPYGVSGMMSGAATCFFGFVGFDIIATTGEEVKNPQRSIPISIVFSLLIVFVAYFGISIVLTLMVPYYMMDTGAPLPMAFAGVGWSWAVYPLAVGATCALSSRTCQDFPACQQQDIKCISLKFLLLLKNFKLKINQNLFLSSLMGGLFPMPRIVYAMAQDGLIFRFLAKINKRFKTPLIATLLSGLLAGIMVLLFDLEDLVDMMSIGTLLAYTLVAMCVLILRYQPEKEDSKSGPRISMADFNELDSSETLLSRLINPKLNFPTLKSGKLVYSCVMVIAFVLCAALVNFSHTSYSLAMVLCLISSALIILLTIVILRQPQSTKKLTFTVPFVPILPILSSVCNIYLMCELSSGTWIPFSVWMVIGLLIYGGYGFRNSTE
uniref:Cationic amino acid transporter C-terminal domain-containing protein n=1 Tax=Ciona savignyi TaxID=51511 RepID=H2Z4N3_CIOSA